MAKKSKEKASDLELLESSEALAEQISKGEEFVRKNQDTITYSFVGLVVLVAAVFYFFKIYIPEQEQAAQTDMFQAQFYFQADSLNQALNGDGNSSGFIDIIDEYGMTNAANLANYYAGVCYLKKGEYDEAINYLNSFSSSDLLVQARAYSLIGDANMELDNPEEAIKYYKKAVDYKPNKFFTPTYILKLGLAYESIENYEAAAEAYDQVVKEFPGSSEVDDARKYKSLAEGMVGK